jgi:hypothetical protein
MKSLAAILGCLLFCALARGASADPVEPKVLLFVWDQPGWSGPSGIDTLGLRLAVYDDGQVLLLDRKAHKPGPHYRIGQIEAGEAQRLAESYQQQLDGVPEELAGDTSVSDMGSMYIQVWDTKRRQYQFYSAYGSPCLLPGSAEPQEVPETPITRPEDIDKIDWGAVLHNWVVRNRKGTDPRFVAACDALLAFSVADAKPWVPKQFWVTLWMSKEEPLAVQPWPRDWPTMPALVAKGSVELCFRLSEPASEITSKMRSDARDDRRQVADDAAFPAGAKRWWQLNEWGYALPGEIRIFGQDDYTFELAHGPCKTY